MKKVTLKWSRQSNEIYFAFPLALNLYRDFAKGYAQLTFVFLFLWLRLEFYIAQKESNVK